MVRNAARAPTSGCDLLPLEVDLVVLLFHHLVDPREVEAPHRRDGAFLKVTATMDIQTNIRVRFKKPNRHASVLAVK